MLSSLLLCHPAVIALRALFLRYASPVFFSCSLPCYGYYCTLFAAITFTDSSVISYHALSTMYIHPDCCTDCSVYSSAYAPSITFRLVMLYIVVFLVHSLPPTKESICPSCIVHLFLSNDIRLLCTYRATMKLTSGVPWRVRARLRLIRVQLHYS